MKLFQRAILWIFISQSTLTYISLKEYKTMYGQVLGASTTVGGVGAIAALPNTGGSRNVILAVAVASIVLGVAILTSNLLRFVASRRYTA